MTAFVGDILSATAASVSADPTPTRTWAWLRSGTAISGQTAATYRVTDADVGAAISARQIETNFVGSAQAFSDPLTILSYSPANLFALSEPGIWLDPSDLTTMFVERNGTVPVTTPGQSVGLRLDKSKGLVLGPELVTNGAFDSGTTGWSSSTLTSTATVVNGEFVVSAAVANGRQVSAISCQVGKTYQITGSARVTSGTGTAVINVSDTTAAISERAFLPTASSSPTILRAVFVATQTTHYVGVGNAGSGTGDKTFDNISVKELPGNHAVANSDAARGIYGIEPLGGRRNLLTYSEDLTNAVWTANQITKVDANTIQALATSGVHGALQFFDAVSGVAYTFRTQLTYRNTQFVSLRLSAGIFPHVTFDLVNGTIVGTQAGASGTITSLGGGSYVCTITVTATATAPANAGVFLQPSADNYNTAWTASGSELVDITQSQAERNSTATAYQHVVDEFNVTEAGKQTLHYVEYVSGDGFVTPTITPGIDKVQVFAGVRKLSDAASAQLLEMNAGSSPGLGVLAPGASGSDKFAFESAGTGATLQRAATTSTSFNAPTTVVLTGLGDIAGDRSTIRVNGTQVSQGTTDQGTGNYLAYPLYIGNRGGASLFFRGRDYGIITRFGANLSTPNINRAEYYMAQKTGVVLA